MKLFKHALLSLSTLVLIGCGEGSTRDVLNAVGVKTLTAGQSIVIAKDQVVLVPSGTTVSAASNGQITTISGNGQSLKVLGGSTVTVPSTATGVADNTISGI
jgi:hypothetical protein